MTELDLLIKNVRLVKHNAADIPTTDIGVKDGVFHRIAPGIPASDARDVVDGKGLLAFPGVVDAHQHWGIYNPLSDDTATESRACAQGGVTTALTYMRTGQYYMNRGGSYNEVFPLVLENAEGRSYVDYGFHLAPMQKSHIAEIPS
ncbi:D-hydantoinase [Streptomyces sp. MBT84]|uniref:hypothetical protein n=1 Tax=Streptomyces sp. MBT84 TaxID=1488414 RepID=UPI001DE4C763|nr:hypothetical protein [Streptomyces sp. MBT84]MBW8706790.1 D-hydantoinase [Streptomyces sp. MBT84]